MSAPASETIDGVIAEIAFDKDGLVPAIAQQHDTGEVLMLAWMDREAIRATLVEGRAIYYSRSRGRLWRKGEESGQVQTLIEFRWDCDNDCVLLQVDQTGVACRDLAREYDVGIHSHVAATSLERRFQFAHPLGFGGDIRAIFIPVVHE